MKSYACKAGLSSENKEFVIAWVDGNYGGGETLPQAVHAACTVFSRYSLGQDKCLFQVGESLGYATPSGIAGIDFEWVSNITYFPK